MQKDLYDKLLNAAFRFVSYRPRSEKEVRNFLGRKLKAWNTVGQYSIEKVIHRLKEYGYIDDAKFAAWWVGQRMAFRPKGSKAIIQELSAKGIKKVSLGSYNELEAAKIAVKSKWARWAKLLPLERKKKVFGFLRHRGFSFETIRRLIDIDEEE